MAQLYFYDLVFTRLKKYSLIMNNLPVNDLVKSAPKQSRGEKTLGKLLGSAQDLLVEGGFEALNSNAIVQRVGMTPPAFYRYFKNKHDVLRILCEQLMTLQNEALEDDENWQLLLRGDFVGSAYITLKRTYDVTVNFKSGPVLLRLLRAIPELQPIRLESHDFVANLMADELYKGSDAEIRKRFFQSSRLSIEIGYSVIEMLLETGMEDVDTLLKQTSHAMAGLFSGLDEFMPASKEAH